MEIIESQLQLQSRALELGLEVNSRTLAQDIASLTSSLTVKSKNKSSNKQAVQKKRRKTKRTIITFNNSTPSDSNDNLMIEIDDVEVITQPIEFDNINFEQFTSVFEKFVPQEIPEIFEELADNITIIPVLSESESESDMEMDQESDNSTNSQPQLSKKKLRKLKQMQVYDLKSSSKRPDLVEVLILLLLII